MDKISTKSQLPDKFNEFGEAALPNAPIATLENGHKSIPQQYFHYNRTVKNVEAIVARIQFSNDYPIFVFEDNGHVFLQVGIIGHENYPPQHHPDHQARNDKIVYGRRWYIEPHTPTSEVIQTVYLAINKVREHEIRELLTLSLTHKGKLHHSTPFNSHIDLPLAAKNATLFKSDSTPFTHTSLTEALARITLGHCQLKLDNIMNISDSHCLIVVRIEEKTIDTPCAAFMRHYFPELINTTITTTTEKSLSHCLHAITNSILEKIEAEVAEQFTFDEFARFSQHIHPDNLARFSLDTRLVNDQRTPNFNLIFREMVHLVDGGKAPPMALTRSLLEKQKHALQNRENLEGYLPT